MSAFAGAQYKCIGDIEVKEVSGAPVVTQVKPVQALSAQAVRVIASANNNGSGGHCQGGGNGNW